MAKNKKLGEAKTAKKDEFYTQYEDIQAELNHYESHFKNKTVLCNCDDPFESNFCYFFLKNFNYLGLKRLICTSYTSSPVLGSQMTLWDDADEPVQRGNGYVMDISEVPMANGRGVSDDDIDKLLRSKKRGVKKLEGDGDFRSGECIEYLKQADIVVTNPPFSLFKEYVPLLIEYGKLFIIIGNINAIHYKEIFPLIQNNKLWLGVSMNSSNRYFQVPNDYILTEKTGKIVNGKKYAFVKGCLWFTNIDNKLRHEGVTLYESYTPEKFPMYENYDAIDVGEVNIIPKDYFGKMGVPDSFLRKYDPEQFEIVGYGRGDFLDEIGYVPQSFLDDYHAIGGRGHITAGMKSLCFYDENRVPKFPYSRIIIRRKRQK